MFVIVIDTNVFVSSLLSGGASRDIIRALEKRSFHLYLSESLLNEIEFVIHRDKFSSLIIPKEREELLKMLKSEAIIIHPQKTITACRDPKDNTILEAAIAAKADCIISGDKDLLVLNPFQGISIVTPREFLQKLK